MVVVNYILPASTSDAALNDLWSGEKTSEGNLCDKVGEIFSRLVKLHVLNLSGFDENQTIRQDR